MQANQIAYFELLTPESMSDRLRLQRSINNCARLCRTNNIIIVGS